MTKHMRASAPSTAWSSRSTASGSTSTTRSSASPSYGFEWTYEGDSPQQLALAILYDHLGDKERAIRLSEPFMKAVVANLDNDWTLSSQEIDAFLRDAG